MGSKATTQIPKSHQNERKSKRNFEALLDAYNMRLAFPWADNDYGIDCQVELISPIFNSDSFRPESKFFLIQLKSTEKPKVVGEKISFPIQVKKVIQWFSANLPVMFVLNNLTAKTFHILWIDEKLISQLDSENPNWVNQESITLKIPFIHDFNAYGAEAIRDYVMTWKVPSRKIIEPGTYFELKEKCIENLRQYKQIASLSNFSSVNASINALEKQTEQAIYRIAITGMSRVGKSTLINSLLYRKDVSPTGFFQTTGVPIQVIPNSIEAVDILFKNGKKVTKPFSFDVIEEYASQTKNEDNKKAVSLVVIKIANRQLERGVSFFDIPGLDDPDDEIYAYAWNTVTKANAILYLIDASPFENGGYIFKAEYKKHLLELGQSLDKIFLVFTKVNALSGDKLILLKERVMKDLQKLNLYEKVSRKVYFISAEESLEIRTGGEGKSLDSVQLLEDDLWGYLLKESKIGLANLGNVNQQILQSIQDFKSLLSVRMIDNQKRKDIEKAMITVRNKIPELVKLYNTKEDEIKTGITKSLKNKKYGLLHQLETYLKSIPLNGDLPSSHQLKTYLAQGGHQAIEEANKEYFHQLNLQQELIHGWIEDNLKQVRDLIAESTAQRIIDFSDIEKFESPSIDLSSSFGFGFLAGFLAFLVNPPATIAAGFFAFFGNLLFSASDRRAKRISKIMDAARRSYNSQFQKIEEGYTSCIDENSQRILDFAKDKVILFFNDLTLQMQDLDTPILPSEEKLYENSFEKLEKVEIVIRKLNTEINNWYSSI